MKKLIRTTFEVGRKLIAGGAILALTFIAVPTVEAKGKRATRGSTKRVTRPLPTAQGDGQKVSPRLDERIRAAGANDLVRVIVQTADEPTAGHLTRISNKGGTLKRKHSAIRGYSARVRAADLERLANDPEVTRISIDTPVTAHMDIAYRATGANRAWMKNNGTIDGSGIGIAVVDTGVQGHIDMMGADGSAPRLMEVPIVGSNISTLSGPTDANGHGTHVAGIIAGSGAASSDPQSFRTFQGIAPGANIISIRALYPDGSGYTSDILAGIDWAIQNRLTYNIRVLNLSLGHPIFESYTTDPLCAAVRAAVQAGIVVVEAGHERVL